MDSLNSPNLNSLNRLYFLIRCVSYSIFDKPQNITAPAITRNVSWRADNLKYRKNEIFLDVVEKVNLLVCCLIYRRTLKEK